MSRAQRLSFLAVAAVIAVVAVIVLGRGGGPEEEETDPASVRSTPAPAATEPAEPGADATATATPEPTATPKPRPPLIGPGNVTRLRFRQGETVRFRVRSDTPDEIHVHVYDVTKAVGPDPVAVSFPAGITGIFEIELHGTGEQIAQLRVDPE